MTKKTVIMTSSIVLLLVIAVIVGVSVFSTADAVDDTTQIISSSEVVEETSSSSELTKEEIKEIYEIKVPEKDENQSPTEYEEDINSPYVEYEQEEVKEETSSSSEPPKQQQQTQSNVKYVDGVKYINIPGLGWQATNDKPAVMIEPKYELGTGPQVLH